jgi:putative colanic acid biosynthesis acetyltransferase WcaF
MATAQRSSAQRVTEQRVQELRRFKLPPGFRGRSGPAVMLWFVVRDTLFLCSPMPLYGWRRFLLRLFGAKIGQRVRLRPTTRVTYPWNLKVGDDCWIGEFTQIYNLGEIEIGHDVVVSQNTCLCTGTHDYRKPTFDMIVKPIRIEPEAWVASDCFVGPGVTVGRGAIVAARSTLLKDAPPMTIMAGHPAKVLGPRFASED